MILLLSIEEQVIYISNSIRVMGSWIVAAIDIFDIIIVDD